MSGKMIRLGKIATISTHSERHYRGISFFIGGILFSFSAAKASDETPEDTMSPPKQSRFPVGTGILIDCPECDGTGKLETVEWVEA